MNTKPTLGEYVVDLTNEVDAAPDIKLPPHLKAYVFHMAKKNGCTPEEQLAKLVQESARRASSEDLISLEEKSHG